MAPLLPWIHVQVSVQQHSDSTYLTKNGVALSFANIVLTKESCALALGDGLP